MRTGSLLRSIVHCRLLVNTSLGALKSFSQAPLLVKPVSRAVGPVSLFGWWNFDLPGAVIDLLLLRGQAVVCSHVGTFVT